MRSPKLLIICIQRNRHTNKRVKFDRAQSQVIVTARVVNYVRVHLELRYFRSSLFSTNAYLNGLGSCGLSPLLLARASKILCVHKNPKRLPKHTEGKPKYEVVPSGCDELAVSDELSRKYEGNLHIT